MIRGTTFVVFEWQRYKFWKQFTTFGCFYHSSTKLFSNDKDTNFESNSQLKLLGHLEKLCCFRMTKIQILKAIHNLGSSDLHPAIVVFEWQRYKFWKQFTTSELSSINSLLLFSNDKDTNFESNSQHYLNGDRERFGCFRMTKIQILKAIHNVIRRFRLNSEVVFEWQRYKFWKQFTTFSACLIFIFCCFRMTKIQILKAIHNFSGWRYFYICVVFEWQRYKFWKQFTTSISCSNSTAGLFSNDKDTNFESNSQLGTQNKEN